MSYHFQQALEAWAKDNLPGDIEMPDKPNLSFDYEAPYRYSEYTASDGAFYLRLWDHEYNCIHSWYINQSDYGSFFNELLIY